MVAEYHFPTSALSSQLKAETREYNSGYIQKSAQESK